ncbi:MAG: nucleoside kinase [Paludibacteraceae bacterium]|nr:nucleoside kinase [Paludibacteraceae bacterium]
MEKKVKIYCVNSNITNSYPAGISLEEICPKDVKAIVAKVNGKIKDLKFCVYKPKCVEFLGLDSLHGVRAYLRSISFLLYEAVTHINKEACLRIEHPISGGYLCQIAGLGDVNEDLCRRLSERMREKIAEKAEFVQEIVPTSWAIQYFEDNAAFDKVNILKSRGEMYTELYRLDDIYDFYYGALVPNASYLDKFALTPYHGAILLTVPSADKPNELAPVRQEPQLLKAFSEHTTFNQLLGIENVGDLNIGLLEKNNASNLIKVAEALQEKKIALIADEIAKRPKVRVVLLAGPSSSGKTTSSKRLSVQLAVCGLKPLAVSLDDYFVPRRLTPKDENGNYDFESLYALDLDLFNSDLNKLISGEKVTLPRYNFETGEREEGETIQIHNNEVLIFEGIHALNPKLTEKIPAENKFKIFVSALTSISLDNHNCIPNTDNRLIRRIVRDFKYRGYSAEETIKRWPDVMKGEEKWIVPFQEEADAMFNSAMIFELCVLKHHAIAPLSMVPQTSPIYSEAHRLLNFLSYFADIQENEIPTTSLLREFVGGSSFKY